MAASTPSDAPPNDAVPMILKRLLRRIGGRAGAGSAVVGREVAVREVGDATSYVTLPSPPALFLALARVLGFAAGAAASYVGPVLPIVALSYMASLISPGVVSYTPRLEEAISYGLAPPTAPFEAKS